MNDLEKLLEFIDLTKKFQGVERAVHLRHEQRRENDAEHSYQLAIVAWYIVSSRGLRLDTDKVVKYALAHDLVEAYAGDTPVHNSTEEMHATKKHREELALKKIAVQFPEFEDLHASIYAYEERKDEESRFVYALDKLLPVLIVYHDGGHSWKKNHITLEDVIQKKKDKIAAIPELKEYFDELIEIMSKHEKEYFG